MIRKSLKTGSVRLVIYKTGDKQGRYVVRESVAVVRAELLALGFKRKGRGCHREYWTCQSGLRALIAAG